MNGLTPSQTVGPFFLDALSWPDGPHAVTPGAFWLRGRVLDGAGDPVPDALVETWQADPSGHFAHPDEPGGAHGDATPALIGRMDHFTNRAVQMAHSSGDGGGGVRRFARCPTDDDGRWGILTVRPGRVDGSQAPHVDVSVFARGLLDRVVTRVYFPEEAEANAADPVLASVPPQRRSTLVAVPADDGYTFDIRLQGERETVFFDV